MSSRKRGSVRMTRTVGRTVGALLEVAEPMDSNSPGEVAARSTVRRNRLAKMPRSVSHRNGTGAQEIGTTHVRTVGRTVGAPKGPPRVPDSPSGALLPALSLGGLRSLRWWPRSPVPAYVAARRRPRREPYPWLTDAQLEEVIADWTEEDEPAGMVVTDLDAWESEEYDRWYEERCR